MRWFKIIYRRLRSLVRRSAAEAELQRELSIHLEQLAQEHMAAGMNAAEARRAAQREFGNVTRIKEEVRFMWGVASGEQWLRDLRLGFRAIARRPGFSATVILTLALAIGANSTMFSLIDAVLLKPLPYPNPDRLVLIDRTRPQSVELRTNASPALLEDWNRLNQSFDGLAGSNFDSFTDTSGELPERLLGAKVSPRLFAVLGVFPALGRLFSEQEERFGGPGAVIISDALWRRRFAASPSAIGRSLTLNGSACTVVGVMPSRFEFPSMTTDVWIPKLASPGLMRVREAVHYPVIGRLKPGVTPSEAAAAMTAIQRQLGELYPNTDRGWNVAVRPLKEFMVGGVRLTLLLLLGSVGVLLLIACANVGCLMLAHANYRVGEMSTRFALGASRVAVGRQLIAENLAHSILGGALGLLLAAGGVALLRSLTNLPRISEMRLDWRLGVVTFGVSIVTTMLCSLVPVLRMSRPDPSRVLGTGGRAVPGGRQRLPRVMVAAQVAMAAVLLVGAGLFLRSLVRLQETPLGFQMDDVLTMRISATYSESAAAVMQRETRTLDGLAAIPGVLAVSATLELPGATPPPPAEFQIPGESAEGPETRYSAGVRTVTSGYFQTFGIPILAGTTCTMNSDPAKLFKALVNQRFMDRFFPNQNAIGRTITRPGRGTVEIIGVVGNIREEGFAKAPDPLIYLCGLLPYWPDPYWAVRTQGDTGQLASAVRLKIRSLEPLRALYEVRPLTDVLSETLMRTRLQTYLVTLFSVMALVLASIGLYGVMSYLVAQSTREIGVRLALGASPLQILAQVFRRGAVVAGAGALAGLCLTAALSRMIGSFLYEVSPIDAATYAGVLITLAVVCAGACFVPGRRAISIDPSQALRGGD